MLARLLIAATVAGVATTTLGAAASITVGAAGVGAGSALVRPCDGDGFTYSRTIDAARRVTAATIGGIDGGCAGGTLQLTLTGAAGRDLGTGTAAVPPGATAVTVSVAPLPLATDVASYRVAVVGP